MGQGHEYRVLATRFRDWWLVEIPNLATHAECRLFTDVERTARQAIAGALDIETDDFEVAVELQRAWDSVLRGGI
jgi:hypothetical protein